MNRLEYLSSKYEKRVKVKPFQNDSSDDIISAIIADDKALTKFQSVYNAAWFSHCRDPEYKKKILATGLIIRERKLYDSAVLKQLRGE